VNHGFDNANNPNGLKIIIENWVAA
jgi:hypothetical protein